MFPGFPTDALKFFRDLAKNNTRDWFQPRKEIFEAQVKEPMLGAGGESINAEFAKFAPEYICDPKKAVYRIYRDIRFSADKSSPYKTHLVRSTFPRRDGASGRILLFDFGERSQGIAGGVYQPSPEQMLAIRTWLAENHSAFCKARVERKSCWVHCTASR